MTQASILTQREFAFTESDFRFLADLAYQRTGIVLADHKRDMVYGRLSRRLRALGYQSFADYCDLLRTEAGADEFSHLVNAITTNLTSFFREEHHFSHLREQVIAPIAADPTQPRRLRLWSSACSSGMEPYSMAMAMRASLPDIASWDARILATDIDSNMLQVAVQGDYQVSELGRIPAGYRRYVKGTGRPGEMRMSEEIKQLIAFRKLNLLEAWPVKGPFDAIFCRNVVIYFDKPTKVKLFNRLADMLKPGGWLYIGHSENLHGISDRFTLAGRTIYQKVK